MSQQVVNDLLDLLPIVADRGWDVNEYGAIRDRNGRCPLCALINEIDPSVTEKTMVGVAIEDSGVELPLRGVLKIIFAADKPDNPLRPRLLEALGLDTTQ